MLSTEPLFVCFPYIFSPLGFTSLVLLSIYITLTIFLFYMLALIFILSCVFPHDKSNKDSTSHIKMHFCSNIRSLKWWHDNSFNMTKTHCSFSTQTVIMLKASETKEESLYHKNPVLCTPVFRHMWNPRSFQEWPSSMSVPGEKWQGEHVQRGVGAALLEMQKFSPW